MTNAKENPSEFTEKRGLAYVEVAALRDEITRWIEDGFSATAIYKLLVHKKKISTTYTYRTFLRAIDRMIPNANKRINSRSKDKPSSKVGVSSGKNPLSEANKRVFKPATGNFVKGDTED